MDNEPKPDAYVWYIESNGQPVLMAPRMRKGTPYTCDLWPLERLIKQGQPGKIKASTKAQRQAWRESV